MRPKVEGKGVIIQPWEVQAVWRALERIKDHNDCAFADDVIGKLSSNDLDIIEKVIDRLDDHADPGPNAS